VGFLKGWDLSEDAYDAETGLRVFNSYTREVEGDIESEELWTT